MSWKSSVLAVASQVAPRLSSRVLASSGYSLDLAKFGPPEVFGLWTDATAQRQDRAWQAIVADAKAGTPRHDVTALYEALETAGAENDSLLEVGCGGGYFSELIRFRFPKLKYHGLDLSPSMVELARQHYPGTEFVVGSAYELPDGDASVDIVMDGVALIHMPDWPRAIGEYARVAKRAVVLHGVTVTEATPTTRFAKYAYGQPSVEYVFARAELLAECTKHGLTLERVIEGLDYDLEKFIGIPSVEETWVLRAG
ncbi:MAG: class I SAM-dependent methyltransferase [Pseudolysinimonas sp.]